MRIAYDKQSDAAMIDFVKEIPPGGAPRSIMTDLEIKEGAVILVLSPDDQLAGIEVLGASKVLPITVLSDGTPPEAPY